MKFQQHVEKQWYGKPHWLRLLSPLSFVFGRLAANRRRRLQATAQKLPVPVIVIGNIMVGGTGKTPVIMALVKLLQARGFTPAVISRGFGGSLTAGSPKAVFLVEKVDPALYGDEPSLIYSACNVPVYIGRNRLQAAKQAIADGANVVLSDDGLQHYGLPRSFEIAVQDGERGLGNGRLLPVGPLRELPERLAEVDHVLINGTKSWPEIAKFNPKTSIASLSPTAWVNVKTGERLTIEKHPWGDRAVCAVAAIGNPERFFASLAQLDVALSRHPFTDHHQFTANDFAPMGDLPVVMTAKDAVKCQTFAKDNWWYLAVDMVLPKKLIEQVVQHCEHFAKLATTSDKKNREKD